MTRAGSGKPHFDGARATWRKATRSGSNGGNCVEVAFDGEAIGVRDSKDVDGPVLVFTKAEWTAFLSGVSDGEFDPR